jgi:hypothetical protein
MTTRFLLAAILALALTSARGVDLNKVPPMVPTKMSPDVEIKGRELEAIEVALRQFREDKFSKSGGLKHFTIELRREPGGKLAVSFFPEYSEPTAPLPARNRYGTYITYFVSLRTLKIVGYTFERD